MNPLILYLVAMVLARFGFVYLRKRKVSSDSRFRIREDRETDDERPTRRRSRKVMRRSVAIDPRRRSIGHLLLFAAMVPFGLGLFIQFYGRGTPGGGTLPIKGKAGQANAAPDELAEMRRVQDSAAAVTMPSLMPHGVQSPSDAVEVRSLLPHTVLSPNEPVPVPTLVPHLDRDPSEAVTMPSLTPHRGDDSTAAAPAPAPLADNMVRQSQNETPLALLQDAFQLMGQKQFDGALAKVNAALQIDPRSLEAYRLRGNIYASQKKWDLAMKDYLTGVQLDPTNLSIKFNVAELNFMQKRYEEARPGFLALQHDADMGDLSAYKVFLCDLFGGHPDVAAKELDAFNQVGSNPSYYFANAAWALHEEKDDDARGWLASAAHIYPPGKFKIYSASLLELGYQQRLNAASPVVTAPVTPP